MTPELVAFGSQNQPQDVGKKACNLRFPKESRLVHLDAPQKMPYQVILTAPKHVMSSAATFCLSEKGAKVYAMEVSKLPTETIEEQIPVEYKDLCRAFGEEASNELPNHGVLNMKIEFKDGEEPCNI